MKKLKQKKQNKELENISKEESFIIGIKKTDKLKRIDVILNERHPQADAITIFGSVDYKNIFGRTKTKGYIHISMSDKIIKEEKYPLLSTSIVFDLNTNTDTIINELKKGMRITDTENESENKQMSNMDKSPEKIYLSEKEKLNLNKRADILKSNISEEEKMFRLIETAREDIEEIKKMANLHKEKRK